MSEASVATGGDKAFGSVKASHGIRCMWMRGGTSKGGYFLADDLPSGMEERDALLLRVMGSPDPRQIDGMGGADPLTSKVAIVKKSDRPDIDVDYLFLQISVDDAIVSDAQNCGNILAGVGPFAIERGLIPAEEGKTEIRIYMENTGQVAIATVNTPDGMVTYDGTSKIDGVPNGAAAVPLEFQDTAGSLCGKLLPTGRVVDIVEGTVCTLIDNGMPCIIMKAEDVGASGYESREELDANGVLKARIEDIRLKAGPLMNLGDVSQKSVPKMMLVAPPRKGGAISVRSFIPHRAHASIGVLAAVTVATAVLLDGSPAAELASISRDGDAPQDQGQAISIEHPSGEMTCLVETDIDGEVVKAAILRTARKLMDGFIFP